MLLPALVSLLSTAVLAQQRAMLLSVRSAGDAATATVELRGDRPLSFTTLKLSSPPRVVVDCADTGVGEVPRQVEVDDGTVRRIGVASAGRRTARVVIELVADAEFDVRASGNRVEVRVPRAAPLLASATPADREADAGARATAAPASKAARRETAATESPAEVAVVEAPPPAVAAPAPPVPAAPSPPPRAVEAPPPPAPVAVAVAPAAAERAPERVAVVARPPPRNDALQPAPEREPPPAPVVARREETPQPAPQPRAAPQPPAVGPRDDAVASARREQAAAVARREEAAAATRREEAAAAARREEAAAAAHRDEALAAAKAGEAARVREADARKRASLPTVALLGSRPATREEAAPESPATPPVGSVSVPAQKGSASTRAQQRRLAAADPARRLITGIGFRPAEGGVVIVRSDQPLEYGVSAEGGAVLIHLPHTAIPLPNNRRPLDTHFFDGPVQRIVPLAVAGGTDVRIELREHIDYQLAQSGSVLTVTFSTRQ